MDYKKIDAITFDKMLRNGFSNICNREDVINDMNVFPVPDGDTGTNMRLTLENALSNTVSMHPIGSYLKLLSDGMLLGARGNSGTIMCQLFKGISEELKSCDLAGAAELRNAFITGYKYAYRSIPCPAEGTILTVAREGIEKIKDKITGATSVNNLFHMYLDQMKCTLQKTPDLLPALKEADICDSGAAGYIDIVEGMTDFLDGKVIDEHHQQVRIPGAESLIPDKIAFNADSRFDNGYCMEYVLQLMHSEGYNQLFDRDCYKKNLMEMGDSLVFTQDDTRIKVHIHTGKPAPIITLSQKFGEFILFKLENMDVQHNMLEYGRKRKKPDSVDSPELEIFALVQTESEADAFKKMGCRHVIVSCNNIDADIRALVSEIQSVSSECVAVLPCSSVSMETAGKASGICKDRHIEIIPVRTAADGYCTFLMDAGAEHPADFRLRQMYKAADEIISIETLFVSDNTVIDGISATSGDVLCILNGRATLAGADSVNAVIECLSSVECIDEKESCVIFSGKKEPGKTEKLVDEINEKYPLMDVDVIDDNGSAYLWQIGVS